ncbi:DUF3892 domain-containing protein [Micromonospora olivasterospora]|uniref:Uncharacterized protein DUF3892 n=1 Tax=Micromonospora olivasterospora TaxID=1880 RepID=A0A562IFX5_MICOL|nr:DUF3892 domain-containing protein [Micromonospora olivasterospora]TWH69921.1 uncharacterized protein DUF3892 [Micromonospora olivasterospora]
MTAVLVPVALDVLVVREPTAPADWAHTALGRPTPPASGRVHEDLLPAPFTPRAQARPAGAHLHWGLPDGLTRGVADDTGATSFRPVPDRWLVVRLSGPTGGQQRRAVHAWLLPYAGAVDPVRVDNALAGPTLPAPGPAPKSPLTALGHGDLGWAGYYDNVTHRFALHDDLAGVTGPVAYLVLGWYTSPAQDPLRVTGEVEHTRRMEELGWEIHPPRPVGQPVPDRSVYHAAAVAIGWPTPGWPGDGGLLGREVDYRPAARDVTLAVGETLAESLAAVAAEPEDQFAAARLVEGLLLGALADADGTDADARLDADLHQARFGSAPAAAGNEYIWQPAGDATEGGSFVQVERTAPRVWHALEPALVVSGGGRSPKHGADGRYSDIGTLLCRLEGQAVRAFGVAAGDPGRGADVLPAAPLAGLPAAYGVPAAAAELLVELACLDPGSAPDLAQGTDTAPAPVAAARAAWWVAFDPDHDDPTLPPPGATVEGTLPSPVGVTPPSRPWNPLLLEWEASYLPSPRGAHDWRLDDTDFVLPGPVRRPAENRARVLRGRVMLSPAAGTLLDPAGAGADERDLLGGELTGIAAELRGDPTGAVVDAPDAPDSATPAPTPRPADFVALRAGFLRLDRARLVDGFGRYLELLGAAAPAPAQVRTGATLKVPGQPDLAALRPRFTAPARALLRFADATGALRDASAGVSPVCGYLVPSPTDRTLEFFDAAGTAYGRLRPDPERVTAWEEDPGRPATLGAAPSRFLPNTYLGRFADGLLAADNALAAARRDGRAAGVGQSALEALLRALDTTRWTVDLTGRSGDEHLALLLGRPVAVVRAYVKVEVEDPRQPAENATTAVPVRLGDLARSQDGLLAYCVGDEMDRCHLVDPAVALLAPGLPDGSGAAASPGLDPLRSPYLETSGTFTVTPGVPVPVTLLMAPGSDVHITTGLVPQKGVGLLREWTGRALSRLSPALRYGPVLREATETRLPLPQDVRGVWTWHRRPGPGAWATDEVVAATVDARLPDEPAVTSEGWLQVALAPDTAYFDSAVPVRITCIRSTGGSSSNRTVTALGGTNADGSHFLIPVAEAIDFITTGRFAFYIEQPGAKRTEIRVVRPKNGRPYLRTVADGSSPNNLDSMPECRH